MLLLADALQLLLGTQQDMFCSGTAKDGEQAIALTLQHSPDVLLLDLGFAQA